MVSRLKHALDDSWGTERSTGKRNWYFRSTNKLALLLSLSLKLGGNHDVDRRENFEQVPSEGLSIHINHILSHHFAQVPISTDEYRTP